MQTKFETNFIVMPTDCNYKTPLIFGGAFFSKMDLCAAVCASNLLRSSVSAEYAVTHKVLDLTFHRPTYMGEVIYLFAEVVELRKKAISIKVKAYREQREKEGRDFVAEGTFVFISKGFDSLQGKESYVPHLLSL